MDWSPGHGFGGSASTERIPACEWPAEEDEMIRQTHCSCCPALAGPYAVNDRPICGACAGKPQAEIRDALALRDTWPALVRGLLGQGASIHISLDAAEPGLRTDSEQMALMRELELLPGVALAPRDGGDYPSVSAELDAACGASVWVSVLLSPGAWGLLFPAVREAQVARLRKQLAALETGPSFEDGV